MTCSTLLNVFHMYITHRILFYRATTDAVKQEPLSDEEMSPVTSVNEEAADMKYEECDVPVPFPVVVIEDKASFIVCNYILTPWSRVLLEKLTGFQVVKKFPVFYGTRKFITAFKSVHHLSLF